MKDITIDPTLSADATERVRLVRRAGALMAVATAALLTTVLVASASKPPTGVRYMILDGTTLVQDLRPGDTLDVVMPGHGDDVRARCDAMGGELVVYGPGNPTDIAVCEGVRHN